MTRPSTLPCRRRFAPIGSHGVTEPQRGTGSGGWHLYRCINLTSLITLMVTLTRLPVSDWRTSLMDRPDELDRNLQDGDSRFKSETWGRVPPVRGIRSLMTDAENERASCAFVHRDACVRAARAESSRLLWESLFLDGKRTGCKKLQSFVSCSGSAN